MVARVRKFSTGGAKPKSESKQADSDKANVVPNIPKDLAEKAASDAPVTIRKGPGNPRKRRYKQKTYSLLQEDINTIEALVNAIRQAGLYERGRSDVVRAGIKLLESLPLEEQVKAVQAVENLKG